MSIILLAVAFFMLARKNKPLDLSSLGNLSEGASSILGLLNKDGKGLNMSTLLELLSNPLVADVLSSVLGGKNPQNCEQGEKDECNSQDAHSTCGEPTSPCGEPTSPCGEPTSPCDNQEEPCCDGDNSPCRDEDCPCDASQDATFGQLNGLAQNCVEQQQPCASASDRKEFFAPVEQMLTPSVTAELYKYYDNWYAK